MLLAFCSFGQTNKYTLTGTIKMATGEVFPYRIVFTESGGNIKGYSYTYKEPDDTKAAITGTLDRRERTLQFREIEILYSHGFATKAFMCLIDANTAYLQGNHDRILKGSISSNEADKTACTPGTIVFNNQEELSNLFEHKEKFDTVITMGRKPKVAPPALPEPQVKELEKPLLTDRITTGIEKTYDWLSDTVVIDIWDGGTVDGDQITLEYNNTTYLTKYSLAKQKKQLRIPVSKTGVDVIKILATNEGWDPPNTADIMLSDGKVHYSILSYNNVGQVSMIKIKKAK